MLQFHGNANAHANVDTSVNGPLEVRDPAPLPPRKLCKFTFKLNIPSKKWSFCVNPVVLQKSSIANDCKGLKNGQS